jgi:hypothetical protein
MGYGTGVGGGDAGGGGSAAEVTQVEATECVNGSLNNNFFNLYSAGNVRHAIMMNCGDTYARYTVTFATGTAGPVWDLGVDGNAPFSFTWGDGLGEGVNMAYVFDGNPIAADQIAYSFASFINTGVAGPVVATANGASVTILANGAAGTASSIQINGSTTAQGQDAATSIPGVDTIMVNLETSNASADDVAAALANAVIDSGLWDAERTSEVVVITDLATGARTDAWDGDEDEERKTNFAIATLTQGA